jgi:hypothetical protein
MTNARTHRVLAIPTNARTHRVLAIPTNARRHRVLAIPKAGGHSGRCAGAGA